MIFDGLRVFFIALRRKVFAAFTSRVQLRKKSTIRGLVHGPIKVDSSSTNIYIGLVYPPGSADRTGV